MPQFNAGESKVAKAPIHNLTGKAFDYTGLIYMGTDLAVMAEVPFHLNAGEEKQVAFPITMPSVQGTYPVHIGVFSGEQNIALYRAAEDVIIVLTMPPAPCVYCGGTFSTEAELITHMGTKHPGKPYLASIQLLQSSIVQGGYNAALVNVRVYIPDGSYYQFHLYIYNDACASAAYIIGNPAGFYEASMSILGYGVASGQGYFFIPAGTYPVYASCVRVVGYELQWLYRGVDTGLTIRVV